MIFLTRHGQTEFNVEHRLQGRRDSPLTALGVEQARRMGRVLKDAGLDPAAVVLIASPLGRTVRTAEIIREAAGLDCDIAADERLAEVHLGDWEGLTWPEVEARHPGIMDRADRIFEAPGGEDRAAVTARLTSWLADIDERDGRLRVVVSHGGSGKLLRHLYVRAPHEHLWLEPWPPQDAVFRMAQGVCGRIDAHLEPLP